MSVSISPPMFLQFFNPNNSGSPASGYQLFTYEAGTTTKQATWTDSTQTVENANPLALDSNGRAVVWGDPTLSYKLVIAPPNDTDPPSSPVWTQDDVEFPAVLSVLTQSFIGGTLWPRTDAEIAAGVTPSNYAYLPGWAPRYGVTGNGATDDTTGMTNMLACSDHAIVPFGYTPLISGTLTIPAHAKLEFQGGFGNANGSLPGSYLKMTSGMLTNAITLLSGSTMVGGGVVGASTNTGGGIVIAGNAACLDHVFVQGTGGDGIRVGDSAGDNCNSFRLVKPISIGNSGKGISIHDGTSAAAANCNAGQIDSPFAMLNGSHGIYLGHCFWVTVINPLAESNTGYGVYLDGTDDGSGVAICRYPTIIGGDANEGNTAGQWYDQSYFGIFINPDGNNVPTQAVGTLAGSGERTVICARATATYGLTVNSLDGTQPLTVNDGTASGMTYPVAIKKTTGANNGDGAGFAATLSGVQAGSIRWQQSATGTYLCALASYTGSAALDMLYLNAATSAVEPAADNTFSCGASSFRWSVVYAATGTINTSDADSKTEVVPLSDKEQAVAKRLKGLVRRYRFKDAVTKKGDGARIHVGVLAQDVESAFAAEGLNAEQYGMFCRDEIGEGKVLAGVRYEELLAFVMSAL